MLLEGQPGTWELGIWAALYRVNPWGEQRADLRSAIGHAILANAYRDRDKRPSAFRPRDFMPYLQLSPDERERELGREIFTSLGLGPRMTPEELKAWRKERRARAKR